MMDHSLTGPNRISYWARTPAYRSALRPTQIKYSASQDTAIDQISDDSINCYKIRPLDATKREIRLIHLLPRLSPAEDDYLVRCRIEHVSLDDNPTYLALSYLWGPPQPTRTILLEGKRFRIREDLAIALQQLQHHRDELVLWVDAICINEEGDEDEKGEQIRLMGAIFSGAAIVLAWLGAANDSDSVMETLDCLGKALLYSMLKGSEFYDARRDFISTKMASIPLDHVEAICKFFRREWWYRVWILQEMALAKDVIMICGDFGMPHGIMANAYAAILTCARDGHPPAEIARSLRIKLLLHPPGLLAAAPRIFQARGQNSQKPLKQRIFESKGMKATEARDHIIALLPVAHDASVLGLSPMPMRSAAIVYTEATSALIVRGSDLQILSICQFPWFPKPHEVLPSWVPDFSMTIPSMIWSQHGKSLYSAGGTGQAISRVDESIRILTLTGVRFDTIYRAGK